MIVIKPLLQLHILNQLFFLASGRTNSIYPGQSIYYNQTLTSSNGNFEISLYYWYCTVAILFVKSPHVRVWSPMTKGIGDQYQEMFWQQQPRLTMSLHGNLTLYCDFYGDFYGNDTAKLEKSIVIWSSKSSSDFNSTKLVLEDDGNLVIRSISNPHNILWQSFDHPTDTWLAGAKIRFNKLKNKGQANLSDGYLGFSFEMDPKTASSIILKKDGTRYGDCKFKGTSFSCSLDLGWYIGEVDMLLHDHTIVSYVSSENETYFNYKMTKSSIFTYFIIDDNGIFTQLMWSENSGHWIPSKLRLADAYCSKYAVCNHKKKHRSICSPLDTCERKSLLQCHGGEKEGFVLIHNATFAGGKFSDRSESLQRCNVACSQDCSCKAYDYKDNACVTSNQYCFNPIYNQGSQLYYKLTAKKNNHTKSGFNMPALSATICGIILIIASLIIIWIASLIIIWKQRRIRKLKASTLVEDPGSLILMKYSELRRATKNFSCKLGEGGFGTVYRGNLPNTAKFIAAKHLKIHCQGEKQFRAEVSTIGMIHHMNLVRLMGICVEGKKRFLIYEYMPQGSLDNHIFGDGLGKLDWKTRYQIALGIAKGLAYLHGECREYIIHCDIKPENILLDDGFNPKIADFGLAKLLCRDFSRVLTTMRGTRGYLAPEWISGVAITSKADVYSYGMMLFEIISGKRNWSIKINGENDYIPLQVMQALMSDGEVKSLLDGKLEGNANSEELIKVCRIAGWCIQEHENDRLSMMQVVRILEGTLEVANPPIPRFLQNIAEIPEETTVYHSCVVE